MTLSDTSDAQITPGGKIPNTDVVLCGSMCVLVLCGSLISRGHISKYLMLWFDLVLSQCDSGFRWSCMANSKVNGGFNMPGSLRLTEGQVYKCGHLQVGSTYSCSKMFQQFCWNRVVLQEHFNFEAIFHRKVSKWIISSFLFHSDNAKTFHVKNITLFHFIWHLDYMLILILRQCVYTLICVYTHCIFLNMTPSELLTL